jgi:hypothetical protein
VLDNNGNMSSWCFICQACKPLAYKRVTAMAMPMLDIIGRLLYILSSQVLEVLQFYIDKGDLGKWTLIRRTLLMLRS